MVKYKGSIQKKEQILQMCKKLFYEKGYRDTTYNDICLALDIQPTAITYHFSSKGNIAATIFIEWLDSIYTYYNEYVDAGSVDYPTMIVIAWLETFTLIEENPSFRRFFIDIHREHIPLRYLSGAYLSLFEKLCKGYNIQESDDRLNFYAESTIGIEAVIMLDLLGKYPIHKLAEYFVETIFKFLSIQTAEIQRQINKAWGIFPEIRMNKEFFVNFKHDKSLLGQNL